MGNVLLINPSYQPSYGYARQYLGHPTVSDALASHYYAPERWPRYDFAKSKPSLAAHPVVRQDKRAHAPVAVAG